MTNKKYNILQLRVCVYVDYWINNRLIKVKLLTVFTW